MVSFLTASPYDKGFCYLASPAARLFATA